MGRLPVYCDVHIHVARQATIAQLARDEQERQEHEMRREVGLATFEAKGMLAEVQRLVRVAEAPPPSETPARSRRPSRRPPATKAAPYTNGHTNGTAKGVLS